MNFRKMFLTILVIGLCHLHSYTQSLSQLTVNAALSLETDDSVYIDIKFIFPDLTESQLQKLDEVYLEFGLKGSILEGEYWPDFALRSECTDPLSNSEIGKIGGPTINATPHYYVRIGNPTRQLLPNAFSDGYYFQFSNGFCHHNDAFLMIGYVDVILFASRPHLEIIDEIDRTEIDRYCGQVDLALSQAIFTQHNGSIHHAYNLGDDKATHGPICTRYSGGMSATGRQEQEQEEASSLSTKNISIYPNPTSDLLRIELPQATPSLFRFIRPNGQLMRQIKTNESSVNLSMSEWPAGIYVLQIIREEKVENFKILKQ